MNPWETNQSAGQAAASPIDAPASQPKGKLAAFRAQYPQYDDLSDHELAGKLHARFYSDVPRDQYFSKLGLVDAPAMSAPGQPGIVAMGTANAQTLTDDQQRTAGADPGAWKTPAAFTGQVAADLSLPQAQREMGWKARQTFATKGPVTGFLSMLADAAKDNDGSWNPAYSGIKAARDLTAAAAQLPADVGIHTGPTEAAKAWGQALPILPSGGVANDVAATALQYGLPAAGGMKVVAPVAEAAKGLPVAGRVASYLANLTGAAAADAAATDPTQAANVGSMLQAGPTAIRPDDSDLAKRAKVGAETFVVGPVVDAVGRAISAAERAVAPVLSRYSKSGREALAADGIRRAALNPQQAAANIADGQALAGGGFQPTAGALSNDEGLMALERGLASDPTMAARMRGNERALSGQLDDIAAPHSAPPPSAGFVGPMPAPGGDVARAFYASQRDGMLSAADQGVSNAETRLATGQERLAADRGTVTAAAGTKEDASAALNTAIAGQNDRVMGQQRTLYQAAKDGAGTVPTAPFHDAANSILADIGSLGDAARDPRLAAIVRDVQRLAPAKSGGTVGDLAGSLESGVPVGAAPETVGVVPIADLVDLRTRISRQIGDANANRLGGVASNLMALKDTVDAQLVQAAQRGDKQAQAAIAGQQWHQSEVAPRFRQGPGGDWADAQAKGEAVPPTAAADAFLRKNSKGGREAADNLAQILRDAPDEAAGREAARQYLVGKLADTMVGSEIKPARLDKWLSDHSEALKLVPETRREIQQMRNRIANGSDQVSQLQQDVATASEARKATGEAFADDPTAFWIDADPAKAVVHALGGKNPAEAMGQLAAAARKDPSGQALTGLQNSVREHLNMRLRDMERDIAAGNAVGPMAPHDLAGSLDAANKVLANGSPTRKALESVMPAEDLAALDLYRKRLAVMSRSAPGAVARGAEGEAGQMLGDAAHALSPIAAPIYIRLAKGLENHIAGDVSGAIRQLQRDALLDPNAARAILSAEAPGAQKATERHLRLYLANNVLGAEPRQQQRGRQ